MEWTDRAVVLGVRRHGESSVILEALTRDHGRHLGLVRGGRSRHFQPILQPGNALELVWRARLDGQLGHYTVEGLDLHAAGLLQSRLGLYGMAYLAWLARFLPEREPHRSLYEAFIQIVTVLCDAEVVPALVARFELELLSELGFGLDLAACAVTGRMDDLVYVSPKSGRAVCRDAGAPWHDRLFALPAFLRGGEEAPGAHDIRDGLALTRFFLEREIARPRGAEVPQTRDILVEVLQVPCDSA